MESLTSFLLSYGYWGMLLAAFLAGSVVPFSSETVMVALWAAGLNPYLLVLYGTVGNVSGSMFNYTLGSLGRLDWLARLHVSPSRLARAETFMKGHGAWVGFFCFLPLLGSALSVVMGLAHANLPLSVLSITLGKFLRYWFVVFGVEALLHVLAL